MSKNTNRKPKISATAEAPVAPAAPIIAVPAVDPAISADNQDGGDSKSKGRFFKLITAGGDAHGRFSGNKPKQAANKALTAIIKSMGNEEAKDQIIPFTIKECTRGSRTKLYSYTGHRVELATPMEVRIGKGDDEKVIKYKFTNQVKKAPRADIKDEVKTDAVPAVAEVVVAQPDATKAKVARGVKATAQQAQAQAQAPVEKAPVEKAPVAKAPVAKAPVAKAPVAKVPVAKAPVAKAPVKGGKSAQAPAKAAK